MRISLNQFARSKSGLALLMYLAFAGAVSAGVGYAFYHSSLAKFRTQKSEEKITALRLVDAFVTNYAGVRAQLGPNAPVPATFRAHSIDSFNKQVGSKGQFLLRWVGRQGRHITTPPADPEMARTIESFAAKIDPKPVSGLAMIDDRLVFRTVYPSFAREQSCVTCHNQLQQGKPQWQLGDVMGAFAIDIPVAPFLRGIRTQSYTVGLLLFMALAVVGSAISFLHYRQINERESAALEVSTQNMRLDAALNNMVQGLAMFNAEHKLVLCNERYTQIYGLTAEQVKPNTTLRQIIDYQIANGLLAGNSSDEMLASMLRRRDDRKFGELYNQLNDGRCIAITMQPMADGGTVTTHQDITEQRRSEAKIAHMAHHDSLTDLPNRTLLNERLERALARIERGGIVATHLLDLDLFKNVNDTLGHAVGDELLKAVAGRLGSLVGEMDTVARVGGDEFVIVQAALTQPADAASLAQRVIEELGRPFDIAGHQVVVRSSVGIAVGPTDGANANQLTRNADLALYRAKADGRGTVRFFEPGMDVQMQVRRALEHDLRRALVNGEFELHYQPVLNLASNQITGVEALIRWHHPERGMISPGEFIPLAEEIGLIIPLGEWAIRQACATAAGWPDNLRVAVNISPAQFKSPGLLQLIVSALASSGLIPERLELEITESILLHDSEATLAILFQLRAMGVRIAMDDFGTGYSSLSYLQTFPFDKIKIDRSFVKDIPAATGSLNIVRAVAAMAHGLGMNTTAEGVETQEQLDTVKFEGCTEVQGFLLSRPLPAHEILPLLLAGRTHPQIDAQDAA
jgi:diguanylate cyclase (GGDEF)-like protein